MSQQEASIQNQTTELSIVSYQNWIVILMELGRIYFLYFFFYTKIAQVFKLYLCCLLTVLCNIILPNLMLKIHWYYSVHDLTKMSCFL